MPDTIQSAKHSATTSHSPEPGVGTLTRTRAGHKLAATLDAAPPVAAQLQLATMLNATPRAIVQRRPAPALARAVVQLGGNQSTQGGGKKPPPKPATKRTAVAPPAGLVDDTESPATFDLQPRGAAAAAPPAATAAAAAAPPARTPLFPEHRLASLSEAHQDALRETEGYAALRDLDYLLRQLDGVKESEGAAVEGDPTEWVLKGLQARMPKADFGSSIQEAVPAIVREAGEKGYNIHNTAVLKALDAVIVQKMAVGYSTQLGSRQANYGTMQGGATGNVILDRRK